MPNEPHGIPLPTEPETTPPEVASFIERWAASGANERANYPLFLTELCDLLEVPRPDPSAPDDRDNTYVFERSVPLVHEGGQASIGRIDLYKRGLINFSGEVAFGPTDVKPGSMKAQALGADIYNLMRLWLIPDSDLAPIATQLQ